VKSGIPCATPHNLTLCLEKRTLAGKMGVVERIQQIQREQAEKAAKERVEAEARFRVSAEKAILESEKARLEKEVAEREMRRKNEEILQFAKQQTEKAFEESGVLEGLQKIDHELLKQYNHRLLYTPEKCQASLVCGNGFVVENGEVVEPLIDGHKYDYSIIKVVFASPSNHPALIIEGKDRYRFGANKWKDKNAVEEALIKAYFDPKRVNYTYHAPCDENWESKDPGGDLGGGR